MNETPGEARDWVDVLLTVVTLPIRIVELTLPKDQRGTR